MVTTPSRDTIIPPEWKKTVEYVAAAPVPVVVPIIGPKNSGKSTFSRFLLNTLLQRYKRVGYLDTDVGQPEFSPPGFISLHIIDECLQDFASTTIKDPEKCFFFGDYSCKRDPEAYLDCVYNLYDYFSSKYLSNLPENDDESIIPLIINTPGWIKGTGYDVLVNVLKYISPNVAVRIEISGKNSNLPPGKFWLDDKPANPDGVLVIGTALQDSLNNSILVKKDAGLLWDQRIIEYFKQCFPNNTSLSTRKDLAFALASIPPYQIHFSNVHIFNLHYKVPSSEMWHGVNATLVGLSVSSDVPTRPGSYPWCIGLGIVRGIDVSKGLLYLITPIPIQSLQKVDVLIQGLVKIPSDLLEVRGCVSPYMSTNVRATIPTTMRRKLGRKFGRKLPNDMN